MSAEVSVVALYADQILNMLAAQGVAVVRLASDSRAVRPGDVFLALPGHHADGREFIADAVARGATAVICEAAEKLGAGDTVTGRGVANVPCVRVADLAPRVGELAHRVYGRPSEKLWLAGVTGTNGKTSVSQWLAQAMTQLGHRCAVVGTLGNGFPGALQETGFTTPDALALHAALADFVTRGADCCAMEVSSIGLEEHRVNGVAFDVAILTNLTRDHLDYHGTMEAYAAAKVRLFEMPGLTAAVLNLDDPFGITLAASLKGRVRTIGYTLEDRQGTDEVLAAENLVLAAHDLSFELDGLHFAAPLVGRFNASNLLAVIGALRARGEAPGSIADALKHLVPPPGRMQALGGEAGGPGMPLVVVDYAHTPDALEKALGVLREVAATRGGALWCVFGCGGERDPGKRPLMGAAAERLADVVVVTSDNPRGEVPAAIIGDILRGMNATPVVIDDRAAAIVHAISAAREQDVILLAGKGHEPYQEIAGVRHPFSDSEAAKSALMKQLRSRTVEQNTLSFADLESASRVGLLAAADDRTATTMKQDMMMTLDEAARCLDATRYGEDGGFSGVTTDSRELQDGDLFVALKGEHFDGHEYVQEVLARGAAGALVSREFAAIQPTWPLLAVDDTRLALGALAAAWRRRFKLPLIGVTGSNGKTTVKEMCVAILRAAGLEVLATAGNFNNDIGLPLTLLKLHENHGAAVIEMGMNHAGEIDYLTHLAVPTVAVINNAQRAHLEGLGSVQEVGLAKGEIFDGLGRDGIAVFNADDAQAELWHELAAEHIELTFGLDRAADVHGEFTAHGLGGELRLVTPWGEAEVTLAVPGRHNARNACAAAAATLATGVSLEAVVQGLAGFTGVKGRLQGCRGRHGAWVIDDSYNANPDSLRAAIDVLATLPGKRILVLGDMGETGEAAGQFHDEIGGYAKSHGIDRLFCLGELSIAAARNFGEGGVHFAHLPELIRHLVPEMDEQATVLVKGSRFMHMERVVRAIVEEGK